ncbi:MAG: ADP-ribosylglycohydrolase family protein [Muribaculaceae bacterium]|nr:ADP-ribosylglycohydrolase family protein [Muribaculaceae bacterium]
MNKKQRLSHAKAVVRGAICGDIIGSSYECHPTKDYHCKLNTKFSRFTDDTVCTIAIAETLIFNQSFAVTMQKWCRKFPNVGYGGRFKNWIFSHVPEDYGSYGNGSAMRVSPVGAIASSLEECIELAKESAVITHNHPEGIKGAQAVALAIFMSLEGVSKDEIRDEIEKKFDYDLSRNYSEIQTDYRFQVSSQKSVPEAIICFLTSSDYESSVRLAVALGGDADTQAAIAGSIAAAYYGEIPDYILSDCMAKLPEDIKAIIRKFDYALELKYGE